MNMKKKSMKLAVILLSLVTLTSCKLPFSKKGNSEADQQVQVPISVGYITDKVNCRQSEILAEKYGIKITDEDLKAFVEGNYGSETSENPSKASDILTNPYYLKQLVGEKEAYSSYIQAYVDSKIREKIDNTPVEMLQEEIDQYKTEYKEYFDGIGIPEPDRDEYVKALKKTFNIERQLDADRAAAESQAIKEIVGQYNSNLVQGLK